MKTSDTYVNAFRAYLVGKPARNGEWRAFCPLCEDPRRSKSSSASLNFDDEMWHCFSCGEGGSIKTLLRTFKNHKRDKTGGKSNVVPIKRAAKPDAQPLPSRKQVKVWHERLMGNKPALKIMTEKRGLKPSTLKKHLIGYDGQRFVIPVFDEDGEIVNIRKYLYNARNHKDKMISAVAGHGEARIYGLETLAENDDIILTEGELDRLIGLQNKLPAVTHTGGAAVFKAEWAIHFKDKNVWIAYDEDSAGDQGAIKAAQVLKQVANSVHRLKWGTGIKGGDTTDFFVLNGGSRDDVYMLMQDAPIMFSREQPHEVPVKGKPVSVEESQSVAYDEPLELTVMVAGKQTPPYVVPKKIEGNCGITAGAPCAICPLAVLDGHKEVEVVPDDARLLQFVDASDKRTQELYRDLTEAKCKSHVEFYVKETYSVEELIVTPSVTHRTEEVQNPIHRTVYNVGTYRTPVNQLARLVGRQVPDPRTQRGTFMSWHLEQVDNDLDAFVMDTDMIEELTVFRPEKGQSPLDKCFEIADDVSRNVTHIYGRDLLHVAYDLVWHSVNSFTFNDEAVTKGWLECLVMGDTRTGKSETASHLISHYGAGILKSCESVSYAGLVGGAQQMGGSKWMVTWGILPLNDRRLCVLDEMSGLFSGNNGTRQSKGIIEAMSSIRSEGKAQITKIVTEETSARTRLIWISNPLDDKRLSETPGSALQAIKNLVQNPEDIARFDFSIAVANNEVPSSVINSSKRSKKPQRYNRDLCHNLVMWAWSRKQNQIKWSGNAEEYVFAAAEDIGSRFVPDPPLVQIENIRMKVARLAVALAARTFSSDKSGKNIVVKVAHVKDAVKFLDAVYSTDAMGYVQHSRRVAENRKRAEKSIAEARKYLKANPSLIDVLQAVGATSFRPRDFEEIGGVDRMEANVITTKFISWRMINRGNNGRMKMEPALVQLLREMEAEGD